VSASYKLKSYILVLRTTERCNVGCFHCSISATRRGADQDLHLAQLAISQAHAQGVTRIHLTGGEPLLYPHLVELVRCASAHGLISGITTSTFTRAGEKNHDKLRELRVNGMNYVMLSYDDPHANRVDLAHFCEFAKLAVHLGFETCVFVTEYKGSRVCAESVKRHCCDIGVDVDKIDWTVADLQLSGRGEDLEVEIDSNPLPESTSYPRCPIVLSAATLNPNGSVSLCNCSRFSTPRFTVGQFPRQPMDAILNSMEENPGYRFLAKHGPQQALVNIAYPREHIPKDMCQSCELFLKLLDQPPYTARLEEVSRKEDLVHIAVDFEGLLPIYRRHMFNHGEQL
jgi:pyruvate-formate lyase-activating enzyme